MPMGGPYDGPPIHTLTIFVNPFIEDPPSPTGKGVRTVEPGQHFYNCHSQVPTTSVASALGTLTIQMYDFHRDALLKQNTS